jgi:iron complex outermembrane receptor protein
MVSHRIGRVSLAAIAVALPGAALLVAAPARAEPALEEVIVTAQKRQESLQDTPISIAAFGPAELERRGIANVGDLAAAVPNLRIAPFGVSPTTLRIYIRGLGVVDSQPTEDSPVGIYLNGVYVARPVGLTLDVANIERVEVLRGPQGTLYGRNTTGGAVNVITRKPDGKLAFSQLFGVGNYGAFRSQTTVNLPLTDKLFVAGGFTSSKRDGWLKNTGQGHDFSERDSKAGRADIRFLPADGITLDYSYDLAVDDYSADYYHLTVPAPAGAFVPGLPAQPDRLKSTSLLAPFQESHDRAQGHTLTLSAETPVGEAKSITGYRRVRASAYNDYSGNPFVTIYRNDPFSLRQHQWSEELQLVGATPSRSFEYIGGLYYFREKAHEVATDRFFTFPVPRDISATNTSYAGYGQVTWRPDGSSPWSVTLGGRYTRDKRQGDNHILAPASRTDARFTGAAGIDYRLTDTAMLYAKAVQGYKAGGFNMRQAAFDQGFAPEKLISYEAGFKTEWLNRRLRLNGALFYMDYKDIQLDILVPNQPDPTLTQTTNAGKARIWGVEAEAQLLVTDDLRLSATYGHLDDKIKRVTGDDPRLWRLPNAPAHALTGTVDWDVARTDYGVLNLAVDTSWRSRSYTGARARPGDEMMAYALTDVRLSFTGEDWVFQGSRVQVSGWVRNLFDRKYYLDTFGSFVGVHATKVSTYGLPRTYGIDLKVSY